MNLIFIYFIKLYKKCLSPLLPNTCRFEISCSSYALEQLENKNIIKALSNICLRLLKCQPFYLEK